MKEIKNIVFDIGMVLVDFHWKETMLELGIPEEAVEVLGKNMIKHPLWNEMDRNVIPEKELVTRFKELSPQYTEYIDLFFNNMEGVVTAFPRTDEWLRELKESGYKLYLLSNYPERMFKMHLKGYDFVKYTEGRLVSYECQLIKPDAAIFELLCSNFDIKPEESVFLDDRLDNVEASVKLGFTGIHVTSQDQAIDSLKKLLKM